MITLKCLVRDVIIKPTIFPDKTSQVWNVEIPNESDLTIEWKFESEAELLHIAQLVDLIRSEVVGPRIYLHMPFLPYGRQDKKVSNENSFALHSFGELLNSMKFERISTLDAHNPEVCRYIFGCFESVFPKHELEHAVKNFSPTHIVLPDEGAHARYGPYLRIKHPELVLVVFRKIRNEMGEIITHDLDVISSPFGGGNRVLVVDDICDGGATFVSIATQIKWYGESHGSEGQNSWLKVESGKPQAIGLYVTHGIFSRGLDVLKMNGFSFIATKDGVIYGG